MIIDQFLDVDSKQEVQMVELFERNQELVDGMPELLVKFIDILKTKNKRKHEIKKSFILTLIPAIKSLAP